MVELGVRYDWAMGINTKAMRIFPPRKWVSEGAEVGIEKRKG